MTSSSRASVRTRPVSIVVGLLVIVVLLAALTLGACGGGGGSDARSIDAPERSTKTSSTSTATTPPSTPAPIAPTAASGMTDRALAAQMVITGFNGTAPGDPVLVANLRDGIGGVLLFASNITGEEQVTELNQAITCNTAGVRPWISVDQEPGDVARLKGILPAQPTPARLGADVAAGTVPAARVHELGAQQGSGLHRLGFSMDLAPVVDVARPGAHDVIGDRSFGADPNVVAQLGAQYLEGLQSGGVAAVAKHFPGLGAVLSDPHTSLPTISISRTEWNRVDAVPFRTAIEHGVDGVMVTDVVMTALDPENNARQSRAVISGVLRGELGYPGLVITDAIEMGLSGGSRAPDAAVRSIAAGIDQVLVSDGSTARRIVDALTAAIDDGTIPRTQAEQVVTRVIDTKNRVMGPASTAPCGGD